MVLCVNGCKKRATLHKRALHPSHETPQHEARCILLPLHTSMRPLTRILWFSVSSLSYHPRVARVPNPGPSLDLQRRFPSSLNLLVTHDRHYRDGSQDEGDYAFMVESIIPVRIPSSWLPSLENKVAAGTWRVWLVPVAGKSSPSSLWLEHKLATGILRSPVATNSTVNRASSSSSPPPTSSVRAPSCAKYTWELRPENARLVQVHDEAGQNVVLSVILVRFLPSIQWRRTIWKMAINGGHGGHPRCQSCLPDGTSCDVSMWQSALDAHAIRCLPTWWRRQTRAAAATRARTAPWRSMPMPVLSGRSLSRPLAWRCSPGSAAGCAVTRRKLR